MPRPALPPTPKNSTDIHGKDVWPSPSTLQTLALPSPALPPTCSAHGSTPSEQAKKPAASPGYAVHPTSTRPRQIIETMPQVAPQSGTKMSPYRASRRSSKNTKPSAKATASAKRPTSSCPVAGQKIARKTAHSVIERKRRSKMNEEFATLKAMVPGCGGQEMHKLAILQASIEYLRYLQSHIQDQSSTKDRFLTPILHPQDPSACSNHDCSRQVVERTSVLPHSEERYAPEGDKEGAYVVKANIAIVPASSDGSRRRPSFDGSAEKSTPVTGSHRQRHRDSLPASGSIESDSHSHQRTSSLDATTESTVARNLPTASSPTLSTTEQDRAAMAALLLLGHDRRHLSPMKPQNSLKVSDLLTG